MITSIHLVKRKSFVHIGCKLQVPSFLSKRRTFRKRLHCLNETINYTINQHNLVIKNGIDVGIESKSTKISDYFWQLCWDISSMGC